MEVVLFDFEMRKMTESILDEGNHLTMDAIYQKEA